MKLVNLIKFWIKWSSFWGGVAALRGIKKFFSLASLADFRFRKINLKKKFKANFLGDLLIKIQILKLKELKF